MDDYVNNSLTARQRRVLISRWVGEAWEEMCQALSTSVVRSFVKCGIAVNYDGSDDHLINIEGLPEYKVNSDAESDYSSDSFDDECSSDDLTSSDISTDAD